MLCSFLFSKVNQLYVYMRACVLPFQLCPMLCDPMDCSLAGSSVHGIFQARIPERVAMASSRGSSWPRDWRHISCISFIGRRFLYHQHHLGAPYALIEPLISGFPSHSGHHGALSWVLCALQQVLTSSPFYTWWGVYHTALDLSWCLSEWHSHAPLTVELINLFYQV